MPLPWLTRWTGTANSSAASKTARSAAGPSTEGISIRYCPPSGKRARYDGKPWPSASGKPSSATNRRVRSIPVLALISIFSPTIASSLASAYGDSSDPADRAAMR